MILPKRLRKYFLPFELRRIIEKKLEILHNLGIKDSPVEDIFYEVYYDNSFEAYALMVTINEYLSAILDRFRKDVVKEAK